LTNHIFLKYTLKNVFKPYKINLKRQIPTDAIVFRISGNSIYSEFLNWLIQLTKNPIR